MRFSILTLFPDIFPGPINSSILKSALEKSLFTIKTFNIRNFSKYKNKSVDGKPFGGGPGMILKADVLQNCLNNVINKINHKNFKIINFSPRGKKLTQKEIKKIIKYKEIILVCGRYEGTDQRFIEYNEIEEFSVGDYVLTSGDIPALTFIDACARLLPEVLGNEKSIISESYEKNLLEYPQYTKPRIWNKLEVPQVLFSGNHEKIKLWKKRKAKEITKKTRPDLWKLYKNHKGEKK